MASDRARITFDPTRTYRSVLAQQGRVTLEADVNEQASILTESQRLEAIDVIGPAGTPDDGYKVAVSPAGALEILPGTMYVGGWRMSLPAAVPLAAQPDWLDQPAPNPTTVSRNQQSLVALLVTEQSITAVEDQALLEVALGGPDTAARARLMQHLLQIPTSSSTCEDAQTTLARALTLQGLTLDPATLALSFNATLAVSFFPPTTPADPCCPPAAGGYLGADNQLVRLTVTSFTAPSGTLLWGWNNASFLFRASLLTNSTSSQVLLLTQSPVDSSHSPQPGQAVEILRSTAALGPTSEANFAAAPQGIVVTLGSATTTYDPTTNTLTLPAGTLPADYLSDPNPLFLRLWQAQVPFTSGQPAQLDTTSGLAVTITLNALPTSPILTRPFWRFAVRPNTPQKIYPQRYLTSPQPAEGPRQWLCDLAIVKPFFNANQKSTWTILADCRRPFLPLTQLDECGCCNLVLDPSTNWLSSIHAALASKATAVSLCFQPGTFTLATKLTFSGVSVNIIGAGPATILTGPTLEAVLEFDQCPAVTLSDLAVQAGASGFSAATNTKGLQGAVTIRSCPQVDIDRVTLSSAGSDLRTASCLAVYNPVPPATATPQQSNLRILNSQFHPGHFQTGILVVNADRAQIEGNLIVTLPINRVLKITDLPRLPATSARLGKQLLQSLTLTRLTPRLLQRSEATPQTEATQPAPAATAPAKPAAEINPTPAAGLSSLGLAHVTATFGSTRLQFLSSASLGDAWNSALAKSGLTAKSSSRDVQLAAQKIAASVFLNPAAVAPAFRNFAAILLPQLLDTASQGIVIAGNIARDVRILNNTIDGAAQGIHVGLSDRKLTPTDAHYAATQVQIAGNTIHIRLTPEMTSDRHGIFLGCVYSALIDANNLTLTRAANAPQPIFAIKLSGVLGPRILIERNDMASFTNGIVILQQEVRQKFHLWKAADNFSTSPNVLSSFISENNISAS